MSRKWLYSLCAALLCVLVAAGSVAAWPLEVTQRITFAPGATSAQVSGQVDGNHIDTYLATAFAGQYMQAVVSSSSGNAYLTVVSPGGSPLARAQEGAQSFSGTLPESGDYTFQVSAPGGSPSTSYLLTVSISPLASMQPTMLPTPIINSQRIQFVSGTTSAEVTGQVNGLTSGPSYDYYLLNAQAGQTMEISLISFTNPVYLSLFTPSGIQLARAQNGVQSFDQVVSESGDYQLRVSTSPGLGLTPYALIASVTNGQQPNPQRIQFAPGTSTAHVTSQVSGATFDSFLLNAQTGQQMQITLTSPGGNAYLTVVSPSGSPLARAQNGVQNFNQTLPESGDYSIQISAPGGTALTTYTMSMSIPGGQAGGGGVTQRIQFAAGATSTQVSGQIDGTRLDTYLVNAQSGQYMQVVVSSPGGNVYLTVVSPGGSPLARAQNGAQSFAQTLTESGDYTLQVSAPAGTALTTYLLTVAISPLPQAQSGQPSVVRIQFAAGATGAQVTGQVSGTILQGYLLNARAGQRMLITVNSPGSNAYLTVVSPSGSPLARAQNGTQSFNQILPESGDYTLQVSAPAGTAQTTFTLTVYVTG